MKKPSLLIDCLWLLILVLIVLTVTYYFYPSLIISWIRSFSTLALLHKLVVIGIIAVVSFFNFWLWGLLMSRRLQAYSGASDMSTHGYWATQSGKFYMNANKQQTGEWKPPASEYWWLIGLILLNILLFVVSAFGCIFLDKLFGDLFIFKFNIISNYLIWYVYSLLLPIPCIVLKSWERKNI